DIASAIHDYKVSIRLFPTAEAYTFLGWVFAHLKLYDAAIAACKLAIEIDPTFGNSYNDIGAYLLEEDRAAEAVPWLEQAILAPRYEARVFAYFNLGRAHERLGDWYRALELYEQAVAESAEFRPAQHAAHRLLTRLN